MNKTCDLTPRVYLIRNEDEIYDLIDGLKKYRQIIVNLTNLNTNKKCRIIDFLSGYIYALNGFREKLEDNIYAFTIN